MPLFVAAIKIKVQFNLSSCFQFHQFHFEAKKAVTQERNEVSS